MTRHSQNGYLACDPSVIAKYSIGGVTINLRKGDVSVVALDFLGWYDAEIEPLRQEDTGGYNCRVIAGSEVISTHGSGTAWDVRWQDHARGKRNQGYSPVEVTKINNKLKEYDGVIRWGNNYNSTPDAMHFEINAGPAAVKKQADRIRKKNAGRQSLTMATIGFEGTFPITQAWKDKMGGVVGQTTTYGVAARQTALLAEEARTLGKEAALDLTSLVNGMAALTTPVSSIMSSLAALMTSIQAANAKIQALTSDPAGMVDPESHPIVAAIRYVNTHPVP